MARLNPFTRRRLATIAENALEAAGVVGVLPTPLEEVQRAAGIVARHDVSTLPEGLAARSRALLGALWFERRAVYVDLSQPVARRRFTDAHEAMHALCPWHEAVLREDTEDELFRATRDSIEAEANLGAGMLIFQGRRFAERVSDEPCSVRTAQVLAVEHGASVQATLHHCVEHEARVAAMLVAGRFPRRDDSLPVWSGTESASFLRRFGRVTRLVPAGLPPGDMLRDLAEAARRTSVPPVIDFRLHDTGGSARDVTVEAHYNRHTFLLLFCERNAR